LDGAQVSSRRHDAAHELAVGVVAVGVIGHGDGCGGVDCELDIAVLRSGQALAGRAWMRSGR